MTYGGMRSLISSLNKFSFFKAERIDYDNIALTSGHQIKVDISKLEEFLSSEKIAEDTISKEQEVIENVNPDELQAIFKYHEDDTINIQEVMTILDFNTDEIDLCKAKFKSNSISFINLFKHFADIILVQQEEGYNGVIITDEQKDKLCQMYLD